MMKNLYLGGMRWTVEDKMPPTMLGKSGHGDIILRFAESALTQWCDTNMPEPCITDSRSSRVHSNEQMDDHEGISLSVSSSDFARGEALERDSICDSVCCHADKKDTMRGMARRCY